MKKKFVFFLSAGLLIPFLAGCRPAAKIEDQANPPAAPKTEVAVRVSIADMDSAEPVMAADSDGNIYVVYVEHAAGNRAADVFLQKFDNRASPLDERVRVNPEKGRAKAWFGDPPTIKIGVDKTVFIGWTAQVKGAEKGSATELFLSVSRDGGKTFAQPVKINDDTAPASHGMHSLEIDKNNRVFMAWLDERNIKTEHHAKNSGGEKQTEPEFQFVKVLHESHQKAGDSQTDHKPPEKSAESNKSEPKHEMGEPNSEVFFAVSADAGKTISANKKLAGEICPCCKTSLVSAPDGGRIYLSWRQVMPGDFRHIAVASSIDNGENFTPPAIVSDDQWQLNACPVSGPSLFVGKDLSLNVVWFSAGKAGKSGLQYARSADGGKTFSPRQLLYEGMVKGNSDASADGPNRVFFESEGKLFETRFDPDKNPETAEIGAGQLPSAISLNGNSFVCFIKQEGETRSVWLMKV